MKTASHFRLTIVCFLAVCLWAGAAAADLAWEETTTAELKMGATVVPLGKTTQSYSAKSNVVRVDDLGQGGARFINFQSRQQVMVNFRKKIFVSMPFTQAIQMNQERRREVKESLEGKEKGAESVGGGMGDQRMAQVEAQRIKYELWDRPYSVRETAERGEIGGRPCVKYEGLAGDEVFQEIWVGLEFPFDSIFQTYFARNMKLLDPQEYSHFAELPALPLKVVSHYGPVTVTTEVKNPSAGPIPPEAFFLPDDLQPGEM